MKYFSKPFNIYEYIVVLTVFNISTFNCLTFLQLNNQVKKSNCSISGMMLLRYYLIKCPAIDDKLQVAVGPGKRVKVRCFDVEYPEFENILPTLTLEDIEVVELRNCPLSASRPIQLITQQLGILEPKTLILNNRKEMGNNLNKLHFSNLKTLKNLTLIMDNVSFIPENLFTHNDLKNLESLDFYSNLTTLPVNAFKTLLNVDFIKLGNNLHSLPNDIFRYQIKLIELVLSNNKLQNIKKELLQYNVNLKSLHFQNNLIETLEPDIFKPLSELIQLRLDRNFITALPNNLLKYNTKLMEFTLSNNRVSLTSLPSGLLANLSHLYEVTLSCGLETIPIDLFQTSKNLIILTMANNKFTHLPEELLKGQKSLKSLNLTSNNLNFLEEKLFKDTTELEILDLSFNNLSYLTSDLFKGCIQLQTLLFNNNRLTTGNVHLLLPFRFNSKLETINLSNNLITEISEQWFVPYFLEIFDLSYNNITILTDRLLMNFITYKLELILTHNQIKTVYIGEYENTYKDLQDQHLKVDLHYNPIQCDCELLSFVEIFKSPFNKFPLRDNVQFLVKNLTCFEPKQLKGEIVKNLEPSRLLCEQKKNCPSECLCYTRAFDQIFVVNCSHRQLKTVPQLSTIEDFSLKGIELNMQQNHLTSLPLAETPGYANVTRLLLSENHLKQLESQQLPVNLTYLDIRNNLVETLNTDTLIFMNNSKLSQVYLSNNSWICDCDNRPLLRFTQSNMAVFRDFSNMTCANTKVLTFFYDLQDLCADARNKYIVLFLVLSLLSFILAFYYKYKIEIKIWLYAHNMCLWFVADDELDQDKIYDAFISYSARDEDFVLDVLLPELENGQPKFKLCVHVRDWLVGDCIPDQILRSIAESKKTIVILSKNFIESVWAKLEFKAAHQSALTEGRAKVIVIIYEDIGNIDALDDDLKTYLKMNTYLKWGDPWFWKKLRYAMPHVTRHRNELFENMELTDVRN